MTARTISQALEMLMTVAVIWLGAILVFKHEISIGALIAFQMLSGAGDRGRWSGWSA